MSCPIGVFDSGYGGIDDIERYCKRDAWSMIIFTWEIMLVHLMEPVLLMLFTSTRERRF